MRGFGTDADNARFSRSRARALRHTVPFGLVALAAGGAAMAAVSLVMVLVVVA